VRRCA
jgi:hypothetical protein